MHYIEDFHQRLMSSVGVTEESALRSNILEKKRKLETAASISKVKKLTMRSPIPWPQG